MEELIATEEGVVIVSDKITGEPVAMLRRNGSIKWFLIKGEPLWQDYQDLLNVQHAEVG